MKCYHCPHVEKQHLLLHTALCALRPARCDLRAAICASVSHDTFCALLSTRYAVLDAFCALWSTRRVLRASFYTLFSRAAFRALRSACCTLHAAFRALRSTRGVPRAAFYARRSAHCVLRAAFRALRSTGGILRTALYAFYFPLSVSKIDKCHTRRSTPAQPNRLFLNKNSLVPPHIGKCFVECVRGDVIAMPWRTKTKTNVYKKTKI